MTAFFKTFFSFACILFSLTAFPEPPNLDLLRKDIFNYHDSGAYDTEIKEIIDHAHQFIMDEVRQNSRDKNRKKLAIVLDIDETSLSNYPVMARIKFTSDLKKIHENILAANAPAIKPVLSLYQDALKHGISVFFVTGRQEDERKATEINLERAGYKNWAGLYLRPKKDHSPSVIDFKSRTRAMITQKGYTVLATIGDQYSDLLGGYAKKEFKLPNPFYFLP